MKMRVTLDLAHFGLDLVRTDSQLAHGGDDEATRGWPVAVKQCWSDYATSTPSVSGNGLTDPSNLLPTDFNMKP